MFRNTNATTTTESSSITEHTIPEIDTSGPRTTDRVAAMHRRTADPQSILGRWLAKIRDPLRCPPTLLGGMYLKGSPSHAIVEFIDSLLHNLVPRVLRLQNINISNEIYWTFYLPRTFMLST